MQSGQAVIEAVSEMRGLALDAAELQSRINRLEIISTCHKILVRNRLSTLCEVEASKTDQEIIDLKLLLIGKEHELSEAIIQVDLCSQKNIVLTAEPIGEKDIEPTTIEDKIGRRKTKRIQERMQGKQVVKVARKIYHG